ncbi:hypothetical protein L1987_32819 [Smallanthus sonchifolius]|uniref:Uncharacterized protein n=1 Tax=Smallanthus sonchifolius TaxID=185202 RepID=A0ACB9HQP1_9ASTR|nr:hypothetical protein L1987_32819 [Smallanthus sonchifolius]
MASIGLDIATVEMVINYDISTNSKVHCILKDLVHKSSKETAELKQYPSFKDLRWKAARYAVFTSVHEHSEAHSQKT